MKKVRIFISKILILVLILVCLPGYISADTFTIPPGDPQNLQESAYYSNTPAAYTASAKFSLTGDHQYSTIAQGLLIYYRQQWTYYNNLVQNAGNETERLKAAAERDAQYFAAQLVRWEDRYTNRYKIEGVNRDLIDKNGNVSGEVKIRPNGQEENANGYGQIVIPELYVFAKTVDKLENQGQLAETSIKVIQYGVGSLKESKIISNVPGFTMNDMVYSVNNCVLTAVTRVIQTFFNRYGAIGSPFLRQSDRQIYDQVQRIASEKYNYTDEVGIPFPTDIDNLLNDVLNEYGFLLYKAGNKYLIDANFNIIKRSVDSNMPFLLNSSAQDIRTDCVDIHVTDNPTYPDHTVTGAGYQEYSTHAGTVRLIRVYDGWTGAPRYIDYDDFLKGAKLFDSNVDGYSITLIN